MNLTSHWIDDSVPRYSYVSLPTPGKEQPLEILQMLSVQAKIILLPTFRDTSPNSKCWNVQAYGIHRPDTLSPESRCIDVFQLGRPMPSDFLKYISVNSPERSGFKLREMQPSDLEGCITLTSPKDLVPLTPLSSPKVPLLALTDALDKDHIAVDKLVKHSLHSGRYYDRRGNSSKRAYFQAVLAATTLFKKGCREFKSCHPNIFYLALMKNPSDCVPSLKKDAYLKLIEGSTDDSVQLALPAPSVAQKRSLTAALEDIDGDDGAPAPKRLAAIADVVDGDEGAGFLVRSPAPAPVPATRPHPRNLGRSMATLIRKAQCPLRSRR